METTMNIMPVDRVGPYRTGSLEGYTVADIEKAVGFPANCKDDENKVKYSWGIEVDGVYAAIWDYKGSHIVNAWSTHDPNNVLPKLFKGIK